MTKTGSCCKLVDHGSLSKDAPVSAVPSELDIISLLKEKTGMALRALLPERNKHSGALWLVTSVDKSSVAACYSTIREEI